jgi:hypothetical protein
LELNHVSKCQCNGKDQAANKESVRFEIFFLPAKETASYEGEQQNKPLDWNTLVIIFFDPWAHWH